MWLLPPDFPLIAFDLSPDTWALPWYADDGHIATLMDLLMRGQPKISEWFPLPWSVAGDGAVRGTIRPGSALVVQAPDELAAEQIVEQTRTLPWPYVFWRASKPVIGGYGAWVEDIVKRALVEELCRGLADPRHPLAWVHIDRLPLASLAQRTSDPVDLLEMARAAVRHRVERVKYGVRAEDWAHSADWAACQRLKHYLARIEPTVAGEVHRMLRQPGPPRIRRTEDRQAMRALETVGLGVVAGDDLVLGPLARYAPSLLPPVEIVDLGPQRTRPLPVTRLSSSSQPFLSEARYEFEDAFTTICNHEEKKFKIAWEYVWQSCIDNNSLENRKNRDTQGEQLLATILNASPTHRAQRLAHLLALFMSVYRTPGISISAIESALATLSDIAPGATSTAHCLRCLLFEWRMLGPLNATELAQCQQEFEAWNIDGDDASTLEARTLYAECSRLRGRARYAHDLFLDISRRWASQAPSNDCTSAALCLRQATLCALDLRDLELAAARLDELVTLVVTHFSTQDGTSEFQIDFLIGRLLVAKGESAIAATISRRGQWLSSEDNERYRMRCVDLLIGPTVPTVQDQEQRACVEEPDDDDIDPRDETLEAFDRGDAAVRARDLDQAHTHYREALRLSEHTGDDLARSTAHHKLAYVKSSAHRYAAALEHERRALALEREIEQVPAISQTEAHIAELERLALSQPPRD